MNPPPKLWALWPLTVVMLFACIVNWPCLLWGLQFGHDHNLHITYLHFFDSQLRAGELYPRWINGLNFGAGSPIFFVQYPLPYYAAAVLHRVFHVAATPVGYARALGVFVFLTGLLSGAFTWLWCRSFANPVVACLASIAGLTMPYVYGGDIYYRGAIGEYSALAWAPLALFFAHRIGARPMRAVAGIGFAFAMIIFSHLFTAVLFAPFLLLYSLCLVDRIKMPARTFLVACALLLGVCISGVYFLPMNAHRSFFSMANLTRLGPDNFSYTSHLFPVGETLFPKSRLILRIIDLISVIFGCAIVSILIIRWRRAVTSVNSKILAWVSVVFILLTCAAPFLHWIGFHPHPEVAIPVVVDARSRIFLATFLTLELAVLAYASLRNYPERVAQFLLAASLLCYFLETRWSEVIWRHASFLWNIEFPWRFSGMLSIFTVGLIAFALRDLWDSPHRQRALLVSAALWLVVGVGGNLALNIDGSLTQHFISEFKSKIESPFYAYANISRPPRPDELGPNDGLSSKVAFMGGDGTARLDTITSRHLRLVADCLHPCTLLVKLVYYPFWRAFEARGLPVPLRVSTRAGLTELALEPGTHEVDLELPIGGAEIGGAWLSVVSLAIAGLLFLGDREQQSNQT